MLLFLLALAHAHNWVHSKGGPQSRCAFACPVKPAPPRVGPRQPHLQVGPNQEFLLEWATGHKNSVYYFVVTKTSEGELNLNKHTRGNLNAYIDAAPASAHKWTDEKNQRFHISCTHKHENDANRDDCGGTWNPGMAAGVYTAEIPEGHNLHITRPPEWNMPEWTKLSTMTQFQFSEDDRSYDTRVEYTNAEFPWIEAVHRFRVSQDEYPQEWDISRFSITGKGGSGEYMIHMVWGGYSDVIDVDIFPEDTADKYGSLSGEYWVKMDHCQYSKYDPRIMPCWFVEGGVEHGIQQCLDDCMGKNVARCESVQVVPMNPPSAVLPQSHINGDVNAPWNIPEEWRRVDMPSGEREDLHASCKVENHPTDLGENSFVCFGFTPKEPEDPTFNPDTENYYYVREDPEDIIFYSTCYRRAIQQTFSNGVCEACDSGSGGNLDAPKWDFGSMCVPCDQAGAVLDIGTTVQWDTSTDCQKCF